ncbi:MAG: hypothetical protein R3195_09705 [Gemmatimonadota bacterium]|nr:hypothetical protein [Gemmatimonadota bacterium]
MRVVELPPPSKLELPEWEASDQDVVIIGREDDRPGHDLFDIRAAAFLSDDRFVVAHAGSHELRLFGFDGDYGGAIGREGAGPGEFVGPTWVGVGPGDTIVAYDVSPRRLSVFSGDGRLVRSVQVTPTEEWSFPEVRGVFEDGSFVFVPGFDRVFSRGKRRDPVVFMQYDGAGRPQDTLAVLPGREEFFAVVGDGAMRADAPFARDAYAGVGGRTIALGVSDTYEITLLDAVEGVPTVRIRAPADARSVSPGDVRAWKQERLAHWPAAARDAFAAAFDDTALTYPAFSGLLVSSDGEIWVREPILANSERDVWHVYDADGTPAARVGISHGQDLLAIGPRHLLAKGRDELDREILHLYRRP